ncbi:MAG TPA: hypothetical protein PK536_00240 [Ignavibacteria bacterium]|nr:hypothetical protein [Bacteroidota bacterium]HRI83852.1 hypothetical protein [Ignavibacteria bacterium]HRJ99983.1 hypothetical protein [Ignavibacteria bacterium]
MKTLKLVTAALLVSAIAVIYGCSDYLTSGPEADSVSKNVSNPLSKHNGTTEVFIKLKPFKSHTIYNYDLGFKEIHSLRVENTEDSDNTKDQACRQLLIYSGFSDKEKSLSCSESGIKANEITLKNTGYKMLSLKVTLTSN